VSIDIILGLLICNSYDTYILIFDQFSKSVILRPTTSKYNSKETVAGFFDGLVCKGFLPSRLITDHDSKFVSEI
ncbi:hypothetical protein BGX38DRAFT_1070576, partial [Terfezia claveryi]